jgi:hypothetical protein
MIDFGTTKQTPCRSPIICGDKSLCLSLHLVNPTKQMNKFGVVWWDGRRMVPNPNQTKPNQIIKQNIQIIK